MSALVIPAGEPVAEVEPGGEGADEAPQALWWNHLISSRHRREQASALPGLLMEVWRLRAILPVGEKGEDGPDPWIFQGRGQAFRLGPLHGHGAAGSVPEDDGSLG